MNDERYRRGDDNLQEIAGLWERTSANGREYIGGRTSDDEDITIPAGSFVMVFPNDSDNPRAPAFRLLYSPPRDDGLRAAPPTKGRFDRFKGGAKPQESYSAGEPVQGNPMTHAAPGDDIQDDDIPF